MIDYLVTPMFIRREDSTVETGASGELFFFFFREHDVSIRGGFPAVSGVRSAV